jgi:ferrous iron transport protein A
MKREQVLLADLNAGDKVRIVGFHKDQPSYRNRLLAMGLTIGTEFTLVRIAPLGDPIEISVRGFSLVLRKNEAKILKLKRVA